MSSRSRALQKQPISKKLFDEFDKSHTHVCLPLHMVPEYLRESVLSEPEQTAEWERLFSLDVSKNAYTMPAESRRSQESNFSDERFRSSTVGTGSADVETGIAEIGTDGAEVLRMPVDSKLLERPIAEKIEECLGEFEPSGLLVHADNSEFLKVAGESLKGQVRLIYMDPPYNTGNTHYAYNDSFHRSDWLHMMRGLLQQMMPLLTANGSICASIDDSEMPYLRVLMDEIVGEKYFVACIAYERSGSAGLGQGGAILNTKEYVLLYSLDKRDLNDIGYERPIDKEVMRRYSKVLVDEGTRVLIDEIETSGQVARLYRHENFRITSLSLRSFQERREQIDAQFAESFERVFRTQNVQKENSFQNSIIAQLKKDEFYSLEYVPSRGKYKGTEKTLYYWNGELCAWLKDSAFLTADGIVKRNKLTDFWSHSEIPKADLANEGGVLFSRSKKPEHLLHRLIGLTTDAGDLVFDPFLGSGTSAAVAHKMARRWIGTESGQHFFDGPLTRLKRVISGEQSGVSRLTKWQGGGHFKYSI